MFHIIWSIIYMIWSIWNRFRIQIYVNSPKLKFSASIWKMFQLLGESSSQTLWKDDRCFWRCSGVRRRNYHGWFVRRWKNWPRRYGSWRTIRNGFETTLYRMASGRQVHPSLVITMDHGCYESLKALKMQMGGFDPDFDEEERQPVNMLKVTVIIIFFVLFFYGCIFLMLKHVGKKKLKLSFRTG